MRKSRRRVSRKRVSRKRASRKRVNTYKMNRVYPLQICALANLTDQNIQILRNNYPTLYEIYGPQRLQAIRDLYIRKPILSSRERINLINNLDNDRNIINILLYYNL